MDIHLILIIMVLWTIFGGIIAALDMSNKEIVTPKYLLEDGYNWFGSLIIFSFRTLIAFPFWILFTLIFVIYKLVMWLFTVGRKDEE